MADIGGKRAPGLGENIRRVWALRDLWRPEMSDEIIPIFDFERPEYEALGGGRLGDSFETTDAAVAAQFSHVGLRNPAGSGLLCLVESVRIRHVSATQVYNVQLAASTAYTPDSTARTSSRDTRFGAAAFTNPILVTTFTGAAHPAGVNLAQFLHAAVETVVWPMEVVLVPGFDILVGPDVVNVASLAGFRYRARPASDEELSLSL